MIQTFEIPKPPSANAIWRNVDGRTLVAAHYRKWVRELGWWLRIQAVRPHPTPCAFSLVIVGGKGWRKNNDMDNRLKPTLDGLTKNHILPDDSTEYIVQEELIYIPRPSRSAEIRCFVRLREPGPTWFDTWDIPESPLAAGEGEQRWLKRK